MKEKIIKQLKNYTNKELREKSYKYFQSFKGGYGEGDKFLGVKVPDQRKVAKSFYKNINLKELKSIITNEYHECRLTAIFILVYKYQNIKKDKKLKKEIVKFYLNNLKYINNWDLVDSSAHHILGDYLFENKNEIDILYELLETKNLWNERIAIISTLYFIRNDEFDLTLKISEKLLSHNHDLIHKAVGWMLRSCKEIT